ncbi:MAG: DUF2207 domain-containing protein [Methanosarcinaceae archaeon]|nr:DUF2207 domain-containing protein [Methanosarcinaceae archaeon]
MKHKYTFIFLFLSFFVLFTSSVSARDYTIESDKINIDIDSNGIVHVEEYITYTFDGTYREVFRRVYPPPGGSIENIQGHCEGGTFSVVPIPDGYELVGRLPSPTPDDITFVISYDYYRGIIVYDDVSEFHYKLWGEEWEKPLTELTATISFPAGEGDDIQYWLHPNDYTRQSHLEESVINIETGKIPSESWYEIRTVFPRIISPDPNFVSIENENGLEKILAIEKKYESDQGIVKIIYYLTILLAATVLLFPFYIYFKYGREPNIDYSALYERELPTDSKPAVVNAIVKSKVGIPTMDGFVATVMDLVYRDYISLHDVRSNKKYLGILDHEVEDVVIEINKNADVSDLQDFELDVFSLLKKYTSAGSIPWSQLKAALGKDTEFFEFMHGWNKKVKDKIKVDKFFISRGNIKIFIFNAIVIIIAFLVLRIITGIYPPVQFPVASNVLNMIIFIMIIGFALTIFAAVNEKSFGRWTPEGRLFSKRWDNFEKYLADFSALKEHPPESIKIWDYYMVYAVALGVAEKALKNMSIVVPSEQFSHSHFYVIYYNPGFVSGFSSAYSASSPKGSSGGGGGGIGGGFGGGGGGAR